MTAETPIWTSVCSPNMNFSYAVENKTHNSFLGIGWGDLWNADFIWMTNLPIKSYYFLSISSKISIIQLVENTECYVGFTEGFNIGLRKKSPKLKPKGNDSKWKWPSISGASMVYHRIHLRRQNDSVIFAVKRMSYLGVLA